MVDPVEIFLSSSLITVQNLLAVRHTMWTYVGGPKNLGCWAMPWDKNRAWPSGNLPSPSVLSCHIWSLLVKPCGHIWGSSGLAHLDAGHAWPLGKRLFPHALPDEFGRCKSNRMGVEIVPKFLWTLGPYPFWDVGTADLQNMLLPTCHRAKCGRFTLNGRGV